jgi:hypothetical protein
MGYETKTSGTTATYSGGYSRDSSQGKPRYDLIPIAQLRRVADLYARGAVLYGDRNWELVNDEKGHQRFKESALRHVMQWANGETDEDHMAAVVWNLFAYEHTKGQIVHEVPLDWVIEDSIYEHTCLELDDTCFACGARDCPAGEPTHYEPSGCPVCTVFRERNEDDEHEMCDYTVVDRHLLLSPIIDTVEYEMSDEKVGMYEQLLAMKDYSEEAMDLEDVVEVPDEEHHDILNDLYQNHVRANLLREITPEEYKSYEDTECSDMWSMRAQLVAMELYPEEAVCPGVDVCGNPDCWLCGG